MVLGDTLGVNGFPTVIVDNGTIPSGNNYGLAKTYTVKGDGVVVAFVGVFSDSTNNYGTWRVYISHNDTVIMAESSRLTSSTAEQYGSSTSAPIQVSDGDTIYLSAYNSKAGSKTVYRRFLCFGCTVS